MEIIFDKKGNAIEAILNKDEQLALAKENNQRAKVFLQEQLLAEMVAINQELGMYGSNPSKQN